MNANNAEKMYQIMREYFDNDKEDYLDPELKIHIYRDFLGNKSILDNLCSIDEVLLKYMIPWCKNSKLIEKKNCICYRFPVFSDMSREEPDIVLDRNEMGRIFCHKMYTDEPETEYFLASRMMEVENLHYELPAPRSSLEDGQLKIATDLILAVDALEDTDGVSMLVVGSSSWGLGVSGLAYEMLDILLTNSTIDLYDPYNISGSHVRNSNTYNVHQDYFTYDAEKKYDLILDDSWVEGQSLKDRDKLGYVFQSNFSVKKFPWEDDRGKKIYYQCFSTDGREERLVSRSINYNYRSIEGLGTCGACKELRFLLTKEYPSVLYDKFMSYHRFNCITKRERTLDNAEYTHSYQECAGDIPPSFVLAWDFKLEGENLPNNLHNIRNAVVQVSCPEVCPKYIYDNASLVFYLRDSIIMAHGDFERYGLIVSKPRLDVKTISEVSYGKYRNNMFHRKKKKYWEKINNGEDGLKTDFLKRDVVIKTWHIVVTGRVTGVGFRNRFLSYAKDNGLEGCIKNIDTSVDIFLNCSTSQLEAVEYFIKYGGSNLSQVMNIEVNPVSYVRYSGFSIQQ